MKNLYLAAFAATSLCACGGEEGFIIEGSNVLPGAFAKTATGVRASSSGSGGDTSRSNISLTITPGEITSSITANINGQRMVMFEQPNGTFSTIGNINPTSMLFFTQLLDGPVTPDVLYFVLETNVGTNYSDVHFMVDGNEASRLPSVANATYSGVAKLFSSDDAFGSGNITVNVDFAAGNAVSGTISGALPGDAASVMSIVPTNLTGTGFTSTLVSSDVSISSSYISGQLYGSNANQLAGELSVDLPSEVSAGFYSAKR